MIKLSRLDRPKANRAKGIASAVLNSAISTVAAKIRGETVEAVRQALDRLPIEQRKVVWARMYEDRSFAEIAQESGLPLGTVLTRMRLALEKLRRSLRPGD